MTNREILEYVKSDRKKKLIVDGDFCGEIDDQYALGYALGLTNAEVLGVIGTANFDASWPIPTVTQMRLSIDEIKLLYDEVGVDREKIPYLEGAKSQITFNEDFAPSDSEGARFIIDKAKECADDEIIFILTTGPCTNPVSACLIDPSIEKKICIVWLGCECLSVTESYHEWNLCSDYRAGQILLGSNIPMILMPCGPIGSVLIGMRVPDINNIKDGFKGSRYFKEILFGRWRHLFERKESGKIMCDFMAPAFISNPDFMDIREMPAPIMTDEHKYAFDSTRRKILYADMPKSQEIVDDCVECINRLIERLG